MSPNGMCRVVLGLGVLDDRLVRRNLELVRNGTWILLLAENLDESLVLLKTAYRLTEFDMLYYPQKVRRYDKKGIMRTDPKYTLTPEEEAALLALNDCDAHLYQTAVAVHRRRVAEYGVEKMAADVAAFRASTSRVRRFCSMVPQNTQCLHLRMDNLAWVDWALARLPADGSPPGPMGGRDALAFAEAVQPKRLGGNRSAVPVSATRGHSFVGRRRRLASAARVCPVAGSGAGDGDDAGGGGAVAAAASLIAAAQADDGRPVTILEKANIKFGFGARLLGETVALMDAHSRGRALVVASDVPWQYAKGCTAENRDCLFAPLFPCALPAAGLPAFPAGGAAAVEERDAFTQGSMNRWGTDARPTLTSALGRWAADSFKGNAAPPELGMCWHAAAHLAYLMRPNNHTRAATEARVRALALPET